MKTYPKIEFFVPAGEGNFPLKYLCSTNQARNCREALEKFRKSPAGKEYENMRVIAEFGENS